MGQHSPSIAQPLTACKGLFSGGNAPVDVASPARSLELGEILQLIAEEKPLAHDFNGLEPALFNQIINALATQTEENLSEQWSCETTMFGSQLTEALPLCQFPWTTTLPMGSLHRSGHAWQFINHARRIAQVRAFCKERFRRACFDSIEVLIAGRLGENFPRSATPLTRLTRNGGEGLKQLFKERQG